MFDEQVDQFVGMVRQAHDSSSFTPGLCGPRSLLVQVVESFSTTTDPPRGSITNLLQGLEDLDAKTASKWIPEVYQQDATLPSRWSALSKLIRSQLLEQSASDFGSRLKEAKATFDHEVWQRANLGACLESLPIADCKGAKSADENLFSKVNKHLEPWTPGSWMVWDVLSQWNGTADALADEATPVLFGAGRMGQVMRLVVEALPGPPGLVTPNWWRLGLCSFKTGDRERFLPHAIQRAIALAGGSAGLRFRWHLEADKRDPWKVGLDGRSVEAAAAVATLAVLERYEEMRRHPNGSTPEPILDPQAVVTGIVGKGSASNPCDRLLEPVNKDTLPAKMEAARKHGLDVMGVPADQSLGGIAIPVGLRVETVPNVGEALELLRAVNRAFDRYGEYVRSEFKYHEEETPVDS